MEYRLSRLALQAASKPPPHVIELSLCAAAFSTPLWAVHLSMSSFFLTLLAPFFSLPLHTYETCLALSPLGNVPPTFPQTSLQELCLVSFSFSVCICWIYFSSFKHCWLVLPTTTVVTSLASLTFWQEIQTLKYNLKKRDRPLLMEQHCQDHTWALSLWI